MDIVYLLIAVSPNFQRQHAILDTCASSFGQKQHLPAMNLSLIISLKLIKKKSFAVFCGFIIKMLFSTAF